MNLTDTIFIAGHRGMVGSAIVRHLEALGFKKLVTAEREVLDLLDPYAVNTFFSTHPINQVYLAAARVGGIHANATHPADFIYENLVIQTNLIHAAHTHNVQKLMFLGSSCIYPRQARQPITEEALLTGTLEPTNEPYAIAKIAGIKLCESYNRQHGRDYRCAMPTNLYGPGDNFHPENSHVIPALMRRIHEAKITKAPEVVIWGSGNPMRDFLHVDDLASAVVHLQNIPLALYASETQIMCSHINVGTGSEITIHQLAKVLARIIGYTGGLVFDPTKPDGTPSKGMDISRLHRLGWRANILLEDGLQATYRWFLAEQKRRCA